jgi:hypothetical protein
LIGDNPPFLEYNDSIEEIPIAYSGTLYGNGPFHPNFPSEDPKIDQAALKKKNLCSFLVYLTQDGICDFSEILVLTLQNGLEIKRTPKEVRLFKTELLLAKQTMDIATESIWKLCKNGTTLPKNCAGGELWRHFNNGKSRYCKERWKFWRRMFIKLSDETGLGKDLPENTRHSLKSVVDKMTDTRDDWTGWKPEHMGTKSGISDPYNPFSARSTSPEPVLQEDYGHQAPRRAITDEDRFGSARIEERRSKDFVERDAKGNMIERPEDDIPSPASKAPDSRKRKRPKIHEAPQLEAPVLSQNNSIMASKVSDPRKEERPELHYTPQKPGAPVPCQSNPLTAVPEETGPPQSKRPRPNPTRPQPRMPQRAPRAKSVRKILPPLDSPVEAIIESRSYFGYVQYQVKFIGIPMGPEWYDSIGFKNDRDRAKIQDFHRNNPWAFNEEQSVALFAAKDAKQDAKQLAKWEAKMGNKKVKGGAGCGFEENGLEETEAEHLDAMAFDEDVRGDRMAEDSQSAASLLTAPQSKAADHLLLDPQLAALQPPLLPPIARLEAPAKPAEPPKPEIANLTPLSESGEAPEGTENYLPAALSPDYAEYPDPEAT